MKLLSVRREHVAHSCCKRTGAIMNGRQKREDTLLRKAFSILLSLSLVWGCGVSPAAAYAADQPTSSSAAVEDEATARAPGMGRL